MNRLSFKGYLKRYLRSLSGLDTNDIRRLADEVPNNYRLAVPLTLYATAVGRRGYLTKVSKCDYLKMTLQETSETMSWNDILLACEQNNDNVLRHEYSKTYKSYLAVRDKQKIKNRSKTFTLDASRELQNKKRISTYRVYKDLRLNHGNVNAYMNGDVTKVSSEVAESIYKYLSEA